MSPKKRWRAIVLRELEVAFSKHAQPLRMRIFKYVVLSCLIFLFWNSGYLLIMLTTLGVGALSLHFWYRYKTNGWTRSYGRWDYDQNKPHPKNEDSPR